MIMLDDRKHAGYTIILLFQLFLFIYRLLSFSRYLVREYRSSI